MPVAWGYAGQSYGLDAVNTEGVGRRGCASVRRGV